jgi:ATP-dependent DNA helicase RecQ
MQAKDILKKYWGYDTFREPQEDIINTVLQGRDTFALMPTGGGKSVCFQVPAMMLEGLCIVISPLIALMKDQVENLKQRGIKAISLAGSLSSDEITNLLDNCKFGDYKFLYISPERLKSDWIAERIGQLPVNLIAVDEAHCVSQWGHDFRPAYLEIHKIREHLPKVPLIALTASATSTVQQDIVTQLEMHDVALFKKSFLRENIAYVVLESEDKLGQMQRIFSKYTGSSIVYVRNRKACHEVSRQLISLGISAAFYHGGLTSREKETNMSAWLSNKSQVMVATNAFGMGIDKPDVQCVVHIQVPENLESYYQEAGRAGRNGEKSFAVALVNSSDIRTAKSQFIDVLPDKATVHTVYAKLNSHLQIAYGEGLGETFPFNFNDFCRRYNLNPIKSFNALQFLDRQGVLTLSQQFNETISLQFLIAGKEVLRYISLNPADEEMVLAMVRNYPGIFDMQTAINTEFICKKAKCTENEFVALLQRLLQKGIISYKNSGNDSTITFNEVREDELTINKTIKFLEQQNGLKTAQFDAVTEYIINTTRCKSRLILDYFGETDSTDCGICSNCIASGKVGLKPAAIKSLVLEVIKTRPHSSAELESVLGLTTEEIVRALRTLLEERKIKIDNRNFYSIV